MATKLAAARIAQGAGCLTVITRGRPAEGWGDRPLEAAERGAPATLVTASTTPAAAYKQWIAGSLAPQGALTVDAGCASALHAGRSLLPAGVRAVEGRFGKGDAVVVRDGQGRELARGLVEYDASDARRIAGLRSDALEAALGWRGPMS
jgi:glutamate 5-kinase